MAHPSHVQYTKFYNRFTPKVTEDSPGSMFYDSRQDSFVATRSMTTQSQGRFDPLQLSVRIGERVGTAVDKGHHRKGGDAAVGISAVDVQQKHMFTALPGGTFNDQTWRRYATKATAHQLEALSMRSHSVPRCTSPGRLASFQKTTSRRDPSSPKPR